MVDKFPVSMCTHHTAKFWNILFTITKDIILLAFIVLEMVPACASRIHFITNLTFKFLYINILNIPSEMA